MNDPIEREELAATLLRSAQAITRRAAKEAAFQSAVEAFRNGDAKAFQNKGCSRMSVGDHCPT